MAAWAALDDATVHALTLGAGRPWPDGPPPGAAWVLLAGHCRAVAASLAGLDAAPAIVRHDLATDPQGQIAAMAAENCGRTDLPALAEGRSFSILSGQGWSQRKIAATAGCSPGHVHKRISLTRLPDVITTALTAGTITVTEALEFATLEDDLAIAAWSAWRDPHDYQAGTPGQAVTITRRRAQVEAARVAATQQLAEEGVKIVEPDTRWPYDSWAHRLHSAAEVKRARKDGALRASIDSHGGINYFTTRTPGVRSGDAAHRAQLAEARERGRAMKARAVVCAQIALAGPQAMPTGSALTLADVLAAGLLERVSAETGTLALT
jgi:ParB-like chromosome segregation protein Spo0J